ncbi:MAG TPA: hypothetical protein VF221_23655 [Chloroflexota bacterium]
MIPLLEQDTGKLPPGEHEATWDEFVARFGTTPHRQQLLLGLHAALDTLAEAGGRRAWVNGSLSRHGVGGIVGEHIRRARTHIGHVR